MQFHWFVKLHNCARWGVCRSHIINRQYKTRTDAASAIQWALTTWNYSPCSWKVAFYSSAPGNGNKGCDIHWIKAFILKQRWQKGDIASIWTYLLVVNLRYKQNKHEEEKTRRREKYWMHEDSWKNRGMWYIRLWTLQKPHRLKGGLYYVVQSCVFLHVGRFWAHWTAVRQAAGERWVKSYGETSIIDGLTHLRRKAGRNRRRASREQTTNALLHCRALTLLRCRRVIVVQASQAPRSTFEINHPGGEKQEMMQSVTRSGTLIILFSQKHWSYPVLTHSFSLNVKSWILRARVA